MSLDFSVVIPIFCEQENLPELYRRLVAAFEPLDADYEIIFVNDHSRDASLPMMREMRERDPRVRIVSFSRNFGHQMAITAGMKFARGARVVLMDGDLQDPPEVVPRMLALQRDEAWDIVYAIRKKRKEPWVIRTLYHVFYRMLKQTSYIDIPLDAGDFCVMSRRVVDALNAIPERNRFVRGLRSWVGFRQTGMEYERAARFAGEAKYRLKALLKLAFDGIFSFSFLPLRLSTYFGLVLSATGLLYAAYVAVERVLGKFSGLAGWSTVVVSVLVLGGVQLVMLGIIGEYLGRIYEEIKGRPQFIVEELIGFEEPDAPSAPRPSEAPRREFASLASSSRDTDFRP